MQLPNIRTTLKDEKSGITYHVMAYRTLTQDEMINAIQSYLFQKKGKKTKKGQSVTIVTIIGHDQ